MTVGCSPPGLEHRDVCFPSPTQGSLASYFCSLKMTAMISSKQVLSVQLFPCYLILIFWLLSSSWQPIPLLVKTYFFLNSYIAYSSATIILLFPPVFEMTPSSWFITSFYTAANNTILLLTCFTPDQLINNSQNISQFVLHAFSHSLQNGSWSEVSK